MTRSVRDAAIMLTAMAGTDPQDAATADADKWRGDYSNGLSIEGLKGMRIGVMRAPNVDAALFDAAVATLKGGGAEIIRLFLDHRVDPKVKSKDGKTALNIAREFNNRAAIEILEKL